MAPTRAAKPSALLDRFRHYSVAVYQLAAAAVFIAAIILANTWFRVPFLGAMADKALVLTPAKSVGEGTNWDLSQQDLPAGAQLVSVNGLPVRTSVDLGAVLRNFSPGEIITVSIRGVGGEESALKVKLVAFPQLDRTAYAILPSMLALLLLGTSLWMFGLQASEGAAHALAILTASLSIVSSSFFDLFTTHALTWAWIIGLTLTGASVIDLTLMFPKVLRLAVSRPYVKWLAYLVAIGLAIFTMLKLSGTPSSVAYNTALRPIYAFIAVSVATCVLVNLCNGITTPSPIVRTQARLVAAGMLLAIGPLCIWMLLSTQGTRDFSPYLFIPVVFLPVILGYAVLRFRFVRTDLWLRQGAIYALLSALIVGAYSLLVTGLSLILKVAMPASNPLWIGALAIVLAVILDPARTRLQALADRTFFKGQRAIDETIKSFTHDLARALSLNAIDRILRETVSLTLAPSVIHVFIQDELNRQYTALSDEDGHRSTGIRFAANGPLGTYFAQERLPLYLGEGKTNPDLQSDKSRLAILGAKLLVALPGRGQVVGWLVLGPSLSGETYAPLDILLLQNLAEQTSAALQRMQTMTRLERRVKEMDSLSRISQGVNITLTFDDVLELIYAQTAQIVPLSHFHITLYNKDENYYHLAFALENNERLTALEDSPIPANLGLAPVVIRRGRSILAQNYTRACQDLGVTQAPASTTTWMGVPLHAGADSFGSLSVGSTDPSAVYTQGQLDLLQAIADQTAGAIVKARMLQESERRAEQLGRLNDISRQLAATLEIEHLHQKIAESAVSILDCEAGLFYLVDQPTGELIVRAIAGTEPNRFLGQRQPLGSGAAGRAASTRVPVLENNVRPISDEESTTTGETDLAQPASLAVPVQYKDSVVGVIEVLKRRSAVPFAAEDQTLLTAFAGQAAIALENVRLYTSTDLELAARVEELSIMQRIDRELNASLEMDRAMRITLEWAMRQSGADAGLIGLLDGGWLRVDVELGYGEPQTRGENHMVALSLPGLHMAVESRQPQRVNLETGSTPGFLPGADHQVVVPIRREDAVIGLLILESTGTGQEDLAFLSRLSDHAAIAISNAQLYDEIQRANAAKSDFVSLVAHELKNPMTSIMGYTELLSTGAVGPVNEMQANFLTTIRSNTERMSTLVSDLNDNSKIEAGRLRLDFKPVELVELINEIVRSAKGQIDDKKQVIQMDLAEPLPIVWGDRTRLGQVLTNLVSNANKYTPEGGSLVIGAEASQNHWDPEGAGRVVHLWLRDNGIGINSEDQQRIFQKFFRSEDPKARDVPGAGLGLNITHSLVEMQGGRIWFESQYGEGTTFHFTVPVAET